MKEYYFEILNNHVNIPIILYSYNKHNYYKFYLMGLFMMNRKTNTDKVMQNMLKLTNV